jgi:hypothetical protein
MKIGIFGDSRVAGVGPLPSGYEGISELMRFQSNHTYVKFATPSSGIQYMQTLWNALSSEDQLSFDYLISEIGHNNFVADGGSSSVILGRIQSFINDLYAKKKSSCKIVVNQITPMLGSIETWTEDTEQRAIYLNCWSEINAGLSSLDYIDSICTEHISIMDDGTGKMKSIYINGTDLTHPNRVGKDIIADCDLKLVI